MNKLLTRPAEKQPAAAEVPSLVNGDHLAAAEFLRRYYAAPEIKKAELIDGRVYMASPVRIDEHGEPASLAHGWVFSYSIATDGTRAALDSTTRLSPADVPQPDVLLRILPDFGGRSRINGKGLLEGPPELVIEIAASSKSYDTLEKKETYRRAGVQEYIVWRSQDAELDWWQLVEDEYLRLEPDADGIVKSRVFPGLWLDVQAMLAENGARVLSVLQQGLADESHAAFVARLSSQSGKA